MSLSGRLKKNLGFLIAGGVLFGVITNVYLEFFNVAGSADPECQSTLIQ